MKTRFKQRSKTIPADLLKLKQQFAHWRQTRPGKGRIPAALFNEAAELSLKHGLGFVCKQTGLSYMDTKARMQKTAGSAKESVETENRFVELAPFQPKQVLAPEMKPVQVYCELEGLKIFLSAPQAHDWENLISGVLGAAARLGRVAA
jgi:hypothetical protein